MKFEDNADGSVVVKLDKPIRVKLEGVDDEVSRLTIPALTGKHMRLVPWGLSRKDVTLGDLSEWAARIVQPQGAFDELPASAARDVALRCAVSLGKSPETGGSS